MESVRVDGGGGDSGHKSNGIKVVDLEEEDDGIVEVYSALVPNQSFTFHWELKNYPLLYAKGEKIKSPEFYGGGGHLWQLSVWPRKKNDLDQTEYFSIFLTLTELSPKKKIKKNGKVEGKFEIRILKRSGSQGISAGGLQMRTVEFEKLHQCGWDYLFPSKELLSPARDLLTEEDQSLHIVCLMWIPEEHSKLISGSTSTPFFQVDKEMVDCDFEEEKEDAKKRKEERKKQFLLDIEKIRRIPFNENEWISIITKERAHSMIQKALLAARSPVMAKVFKDNSDESQMGISIVDVEDNVVNAVIEYLKSGDTELLKDQGSLMDLLKTAEKFELAELKEDCEYALVDSLTVENSISVLIEADKQRAVSILKPRTIEFINRRREEVKKTKAFQEAVVKHPNIFVDLFMA